MIALCDCNNFYVSCEKAFNPSLESKPIAVLSNNDGCIISRSDEAKALGIKMAQPAFYIKELIKEHNVQLFSSNYALYGDMSERVMNILSSYSQSVEIYSIDEAFIDLSSYKDQTLISVAEDIILKVGKWTGIPVSIGIAPTKTLSKIAAGAAKRNNRIWIMDSKRKHDIALRNTVVNDIWGIGRQYSNMLIKNNVITAYDLSQKPDTWIRKNMTIQGLRTKMELLGEPCIEMEEVQADKKAICTSRAFGKKIDDIKLIREAVSTYATRCAEKLRKQGTVANIISVFIHTDPFSPNDPQYRKNINITLPSPSADSNILIEFANLGLEKIYKKGYLYKKAGVIVDSLESNQSIQQSLFDNKDNKKGEGLMKTMDVLNSRYGRDKIKFAVLGDGKEWRLRQEKMSGRYTTRWDEIIKVKV